MSAGRNKKYECFRWRSMSKMRFYGVCACQGFSTECYIIAIIFIGFLIVGDVVDKHTRNCQIGQNLRDVFETVDEIKRFRVARYNNG